MNTAGAIKQMMMLGLGLEDALSVVAVWEGADMRLPVTIDNAPRDLLGPAPVREKKKRGLAAVRKITEDDARRRPYSPEFENSFWLPYPQRQTMSKLRAWWAWLNTPEDERAAAVKALPLYAAHLATKPDSIPVHAERFLSKRRAESLLEETLAPQLVAGSGPLVPVMPSDAVAGPLVARWRAEHAGEMPGKNDAGAWMLPAVWVDATRTRMAARAVG